MENIVKKNDSAICGTDMRFQAAVNLCGDGICFTDMDGNVEIVNHAWAKMHGYDKEELPGKPFQIFFSEKVFTTTVQSFLDKLSQEGLVSGELQHMGLGDLTFHAWVLAQELKDSNGNKQAHIFIAHPMGERERALREKEENYRVFLEDASIAFFMMDLDGQYTYTNKAGERLSGYTLEEAQSQKISFLQLICEEDRERILRDFQLVAEGVPNAGSRTYRFRDKAGNLKYAEVNTLPITVGGTIAGFHGTVMDVTQRIDAATRLQRARSFEALSALANGISQSFNASLSKVIGFSELAMEHLEKDHPVYPAIMEILKESSLSKDLVKRILQAGAEAEQHAQPLRLQTMVDNVLHYMRSTQPKNVKMLLDMDPSCEPILASSSEIQQVLMNLYANACQAMAERGGTLSLSVKPFLLDKIGSSRYARLSPGRYVQLVVRDTGVGMDEETIRKAFEPYFTTRKGSDGLGLWICHGVVRRHGGEIDIHTELGKGSTLTLLFPVCSPDVSMPSTAQSVELCPQGLLRLLLVCNETHQIHSRLEPLWEIGYRVMIFHDVLEAYSVFEQWHDSFDVAILEMDLLKTSGMEMIQKLRAKKQDLQILVMGKEFPSQETDPLFQARCEFLQDPVSHEDLIRAIPPIP